jgi:D-serine deaminase-like pyridoxal phosphate-dependent protein
VDGVDNVRELAAAAPRPRKKLRVVIEVDIGLKRAGTDPGEPRGRLGRSEIAAIPACILSASWVGSACHRQLPIRPEKERASPRPSPC